MPLPLIIAGVAGVIGAGGHLIAKQTNEDAERVSRKAQRIYNDEKSSLESSRNEMEESLLAFGYAKTNVLNSSVKQFLQAFERLQNAGLDFKEKDSKLVINKQSALKLREMSDIYSSTISSGAAGAATGALIGLAASGSLSIVTGGVSLAGACLATGDIVGAAAIAGSSLSLGLSFTPLATIAAPVVLFTGISANINADENLEKANTMLAEAEKAVEQMKISETMCNAVSKKSEMLRSLLVDLNKVFSKVVEELDSMTEGKIRNLNREIEEGDLSQEEEELAYVTYALAEAVNEIIGVPLVNKDGKLTSESQTVYDEVQEKYKEMIEEQPKSKIIFCTGCGKEIKGEAKFCNYCGRKNTYELKIDCVQVQTDIKEIVEEQSKSITIYCTGCGKEIQRAVKFCNYCGKKNTYMEG